MWKKASKEQYIKLTLAVYRVTELFPESEDLKPQIRESANNILADLICNKSESGYQNIEIIKNLFNVAESQNLVDPRNFLVLRQEYDKIQKLVDGGDTGKHVENSFPKFNSLKKLNGKRQEKILEILKERKAIKVGELLQTFPQISRRTLIRDMEDLYRTGVVVRNGNGRGSHYNIR